MSYPGMKCPYPDINLSYFLAIVHGVGSYGHPPVIQHKLYKGSSATTS
jgi:isopentenyl phosphate kinase